MKKTLSFAPLIFFAFAFSVCNAAQKLSAESESALDLKKLDGEMIIPAIIIFFAWHMLNFLGNFDYNLEKAVKAIACQRP